MNNNVKQHINSGILEAYVTGTTTPAEEREVIYLKQKYPEVRAALMQLETDMENMARLMAVSPPPNMWDKIEAEIDGIILREKTEPSRFTEQQKRKTYNQPDIPPQYIDVEAESNHMRIHKAWKWVFAIVFILGKIFLGVAIYFYLENRQALEQIKELKSEIQALR
jgi:hypothetical protein